jgi:2-dehydropantoate 2-reductase
MTERWYVLGAGAIGSLFAAFMQRGGGEVVLLDHRGGNADARSIDIDGLEPCGRFTYPVSPVDAPENIDHLLVTTKAYMVLPALASVRHRLRDATNVVLMVNGMGLDAAIHKAHPGLSLTLATTTEGAYRRADGSVCHAGSGRTLMGAAGGTASAPPWFDLFSRSVPDCHWEDDMATNLWRKLAINAAINPLTAVLGCSNGELAGEPAGRVRALCAEITTVADAAGMARAVEELERIVFDVINSTANNRSSMLQDVEAGRPTEIEYITGWLVEQANKLGVDAANNTRLLEAVRTHAR